MIYPRFPQWYPVEQIPFIAELSQRITIFGGVTYGKAVMECFGKMWMILLLKSCGDIACDIMKFCWVYFSHRENHAKSQVSWIESLIFAIIPEVVAESLKKSRFLWLGTHTQIYIHTYIYKYMCIYIYTYLYINILVNYNIVNVEDPSVRKSLANL